MIEEVKWEYWGKINGVVVRRLWFGGKEKRFGVIRR